MSLASCPWCQMPPRSYPSATQADHNGSFEAIACVNERCPVQPALADYLPWEQAVQVWNSGAQPKEGRE